MFSKSCKTAAILRRWAPYDFSTDLRILFTETDVLNVWHLMVLSTTHSNHPWHTISAQNRTKPMVMWSLPSLTRSPMVWCRLWLGNLPVNGLPTLFASSKLSLFSKNRRHLEIPALVKLCVDVNRTTFC